MTNKEKYREFCKNEKNLPIFSKDWWLDAVCGKDSWDVAIFERGGQIWGTMPYYKNKKFGFTFLNMPKLTQTLGPYIKYPAKQKYYKRLSWEKEVMNELINQLPNFNYFNQNFHHSITNWLPFYWKGFKQTTRYTYLIKKDLKINDLLKEFQTDVRRRIRKAEMVGIKVVESEDIQLFYSLNKRTFERKGMFIPYTYEIVQRIYKKASINNSCKILIAYLDDNPIAGAFFVYDDNTVYYLMGGIDPENKDLGAMDFIMFEGIKFALTSGKNFDFEGSMIESIERYFRSFGAIQKPYFNVYKFNSSILKIYHCIKR